MSSSNVFYVTEEGLEKIKEELEYLTGEKREEISQKLEIAISHGDLSENADYAYAKQEQAFTEGRIKDLEDSLRRAKLIDNGGRNDRVRVGNTVTVVEEGFEDTPDSYYIVGVHEADPSNGRISNESPFGKALLGEEVGAKVKVNTPAGIIELKVTKIE